MSATKTRDKRWGSSFKNCNVDFMKDFKVTGKSNTQEYNMFLCMPCNFLFETLLFFSIVSQLFQLHINFKAANMLQNKLQIL